MRLICTAQQLTGDYGTVTAGQEFDCPDDVAQQLLAVGSVRKPGPPRVRYETKVIVPEAPEVGARLPFRDMPVSHEESSSVAAEGDRVLPESDVPEQGAADNRRRGRRARFNLRGQDTTDPSG